MMEWTRVKPSQEGWYWMRRPGRDGVIVRVMLFGYLTRKRWVVVEDGESEDLDSFIREYEWSSEPITEPSSVKR